MGNLYAIINEINKKYKSELVKVGTKIESLPKIPFSSPRANYITYGGIPIGKATEFFGAEQGGKTTSALDICKNAQLLALKEYDEEVKKLEEEIENTKSEKQRKELEAKLDEIAERGPRKVVYVDTENTLDEEWAKKLGVDTDSLILIRPEDQTAEQVLQIIIDIIKTGDVILLVLDSVPMLVPQSLYEKTMEDKAYAGVAGPMAIFSSRISPIISKNKTALLMINQLRDDLLNAYNPYKTPGGRALKHLYALRIMFRRGSFIDEDNSELKNSAEEPAGNLVEMNIVKTKVCKPDRRVGFYTLKYNSGIDIISDTVDMAIRYNLIQQSGAWFFILDENGEVLNDINGNPLKFQGKAKLLKYLREDEIIMEELLNKIEKLIME